MRILIIDRMDVLARISPDSNVFNSVWREQDDASKIMESGTFWKIGSVNNRNIRMYGGGGDVR